MVTLLFFSLKGVLIIFIFYQKHKKILSLFLCVMLVITVVGTSYVEVHAFVPLLVAGVVVTAGVVATLTYLNALGYRAADESDMPTFGEAVFDSMDSVHQDVMTAVGVAIVAGGEVAKYVKISAEYAAYLKAKAQEFFNSVDNTYTVQITPGTEPLGSFSRDNGTIYCDVEIGTRIQFYDSNNSYCGGWTYTFACAESYIFQGYDSKIYRLSTFTSIRPSTFTPGFVEPVYAYDTTNGDFTAGTSTSIPLDTGMDNRRLLVPPLPLELPTVAINGTTSIPYDTPYVDSLPTDVVTDMAADVPISLTDALTVPATVVPETTTGNTDLDQVKLPLTLKDKFPFCIPFDFLKAIGMLRASPIAPRFDYEFSIASIGFNQHFIIDFSMFDSLAYVLRWFLSLLFTVLLIVATRRFLV